jgi:hypothetical protein
MYKFDLIKWFTITSQIVNQSINQNGKVQVDHPIMLGYPNQLVLINMVVFFTLVILVIWLENPIKKMMNCSSDHTAFVLPSPSLEKMGCVCLRHEIYLFFM